MSSLQRTAHVTGLNNAFANQYPEPGSYYRPQGGGAPGILAGPAAGFTVAMGLWLPTKESNDVWMQFEPYAAGNPGPYDESVPDLELLAGTFNDGIDDGWVFLTGDGDIECQVGDGIVAVASQEFGICDYILLVSFIGNDTPYGGVGDMQLVSGDNGVAVDQAIPTTYTPQQEFTLGGTASSFAEQVADTGVVGGALRTQINSLWITEGIPGQEEVAEFFAQSQQAGQIIPQAWAAARTAADPNPETPDAPTGHHWTASDLAISQGIGGTWTDRISGVVLERVGVEGRARELAKGHNYFPTLL